MQKPEHRELWLALADAYKGRPTITLDEFLRDFMSGRGGQPMKRKSAQNMISAGTFPVPILNDRILVRDVADWLHRERTKVA